ncbi:MAG: type II toxin-antitoxin system ParD family antitoxin, partial [Pseudomonadota bacterium]
MQAWQGVELILTRRPESLHKRLPLVTSLKSWDIHTPTPQPEETVRQRVASGLYASANEVAREALHLMEEQDRTRAVRLEALRQDIRDGLDSGEPTLWDPERIKREDCKKKPPAPWFSARIECPKLSKAAVLKTGGGGGPAAPHPAHPP